jgi:DNA-binding CsgD family transcriptional regulator
MAGSSEPALDLGEAARRARILEMHHEGLKHREIAEREGCSVPNVAYHLRAAGVPRKRSGRPGPDRRRRMLARRLRMARFYLLGLSQGEIADRLGVAQPTVSEGLRALGVTPPVGRRGRRSGPRETKAAIRPDSRREALQLLARLYSEKIPFTVNENGAIEWEEVPS